MKKKHGIMCAKGGVEYMEKTCQTCLNRDFSMHSRSEATEEMLAFSR